MLSKKKCPCFFFWGYAREASFFGLVAKISKLPTNTKTNIHLKKRAIFPFLCDLSTNSYQDYSVMRHTNNAELQWVVSQLNIVRKGLLKVKYKQKFFDFVCLLKKLCERLCAR